MAKTNTDLILELRDAVATLKARMDQVQEKLLRLDDDNREYSDRAAELDKQLAVLNHQVNDHQKTLDKRDAQRWAIIIAVIGSALTLIVNIVISFLRR